MDDDEKEFTNSWKRVKVAVHSTNAASVAKKRNCSFNSCVCVCVWNCLWIVREWLWVEMKERLAPTYRKLANTPSFRCHMESGGRSYSTFTSPPSSSSLSRCWVWVCVCVGRLKLFRLESVCGRTSWPDVVFLIQEKRGENMLGRQTMARRETVKKANDCWWWQIMVMREETQRNGDGVQRFWVCNLMPSVLARQ